MKFLNVIDKINDTTGRCMSFFIPVLAGLLVFELILRYIFKSPTTWAHDITQMLFGATYMLGAGYTLYHNAHVNMDMFYSRFSARNKLRFDIITGALMVVFTFVLSWKSVFMAYESIIFKETLAASAFDPPLYPIKTVFALGCFLFFLQAAAKLTKAFSGIYSDDTNKK
ncbi:MAG: TRAP transporter small permease subunit [Desulfobacteraceae bacterium]|nr:MAG: TRAP transporter small permease subunit [Desulfobacteraceae bacterium]